MTDNQMREFERLRNIMIKSIDTMEMPSYMSEPMAKLFKQIVGVREGSMTRHLIDHFAKSIVEDTVKD